MQDNIEKLQKQIEELEKAKEEYLTGWQRAKADFLNYKKEEKGRTEDLGRYFTERFLLKLLPVLDNLERAEKQISQEQKKDGTVRGLLQTGMQLRDFLKSHGVKEVKAEGQSFNAEFHEAVGEVEMKEKKQGEIAQVLEKGYTLHNKLLRAAKVKLVK